MADEKKSERLTVWLPMRVELELRRLAEHDARTLSEYVGMVLQRHVFGHASKSAYEAADAQRGDERRSAQGCIERDAE